MAEQATRYVDETTWHQLFGARRHKRCKLLAETAKSILTANRRVHDLVGWVASQLVALLGGDRIVQTFAKELAKSISLPQDVKVIAVARGIQVTGVLLCLASGDKLDQCHCFIDLSLAETKARVKEILVIALQDWTSLAAYPPKGPADSTQT